ncbi:MMPL family transporter [Streptomyces griseorubiginosus]|uniref:MMPL family transporter n=1 Tax=Streptomyces griseorubiginosus TaxID=67304 RepID=UPI001C6402D9|nr:MMPL family transporter [Streptomyces griseorubiginosus]
MILLWVLIAVAGAFTSPTTVSRLSYSFDLPGKPAFETNSDIVERFGGGGATDPLLVVWHGTAKTSARDAGVLREFDRAAEGVARSVPGTRVITPRTAPDLVTSDGSVAVAVLYPPVAAGPDPYVRALPALRKALAGAHVAGRPLELTGAALLAEVSSGEDRGTLAEILFGALGALVVLVLVFGSLLAAIPLVIAACSILGTFLCLLGLTSLTDVSFVVQFLVGLIGLGVAIDYSLLIAMRWREELATGVDNDTAVRRAMATAGRSVVFSGVTVAVSLAALIAVPLPFLRSIGLGGLLIPLLSVAASVSLLPVALATAGPRLQWPRRRTPSPQSRLWRKIATWVVKHRWPAVVASTGLLAVLALPAFDLMLGTPRWDAAGTTNPAAATAESAIKAGIPPGVLRPTEILIPSGRVAAAVPELSAVEGVATVVAPEGPPWQADGERLVLVWTAADASSETAKHALDQIRALDAGKVGGSSAEDDDFVSAVYGHIGWVVLGVAAVTFALLARALRSLWLPVKALLLNVLSLGAAYGITVWIWQEGHGTSLLFGIPASGSVTTWVPVAAFAFLFGLSMDYEVFILSRMRESHDDGADTPTAVVEGTANTGRLVTCAALILFLAFVALSTVPSVDVKILATTLALGIAIDALIVRSFLAPALVAAVGSANWTLPHTLGRILRVPR